MQDPVRWNELQMWSRRTDKAEPVTQLHCDTVGQAPDLQETRGVFALQGC